MKMWLVEEKNIERSSVFWNMMSSSMNSIVSMFLLFVVTRVCGVRDAGIFSLGFSTAQLMLTIGNYGMRNYQATDLNSKYSMRVYLSSRIVTNVLMMGIVFVFVISEGYFLEKAMVTILLCLLKVTDAVDDVYGGNYQKNGRLDISGKIMTIRILLYVVVFCAGLIITKSIVSACFYAILVSGISLCVLVGSTKELYKLEKPCRVDKKVVSLLKECFPLCISAFLQIYMGNAAKYAIDANMSEVSQASYNYLFMPCFVINLFVGFALQPLLVKMSSAWLHQQYRKFLKLCTAIFGVAVSLAIVVIALGRLLGCQILSIVFGVDLLQYKNTLTVLLIGGAFFAFSVIEQIILTVMRKQVYLIWGFGVASITAFIASNPMVIAYGLQGAAWSYTIAAGMLFAIQIVLIILFYNQHK